MRIRSVPGAMILLLIGAVVSSAAMLIGEAHRQALGHDLGNNTLVAESAIAMIVGVLWLVWRDGARWLVAGVACFLAATVCLGVAWLAHPDQQSTILWQRVADTEWALADEIRDARMYGATPAGDRRIARLREVHCERYREMQAFDAGDRAWSAAGRPATPLVIALAASAAGFASAAAFCIWRWWQTATRRSRGGSKSLRSSQ